MVCEMVGLLSVTWLTGALQNCCGSGPVLRQLKNAIKAGYAKCAPGEGGNATKNKPMAAVDQQLAEPQQT